MSARSVDRTRDRRGTLRGITHQLPLLAVLVVLWMLLWGSLSLLNLITGVVVAIAVTRIFYLPAVELSGRFNPLWFLWFVVSFAWELVVASAQVTAQAFSPRGIRSNAVVEVALHSRSDFVVTLTAIALSLVPGSIILEIDRDESLLFVHALGARDQRDIDRVRENAHAVEARIIRALGAPHDLERISA